MCASLISISMGKCVNERLNQGTNEPSNDNKCGGHGNKEGRCAGIGHVDQFSECIADRPTD